MALQGRLPFESVMTGFTVRKNFQHHYVAKYPNASIHLTEPSHCLNNQIVF